MVLPLDIPTKLTFRRFLGRQSNQMKRTITILLVCLIALATLVWFGLPFASKRIASPYLSESGFELTCLDWQFETLSELKLDRICLQHDFGHLVVEGGKVDWLNKTADIANVEITQVHSNTLMMDSSEPNSAFTLASFPWQRLHVEHIHFISPQLELPLHFSLESSHNSLRVNGLVRC